MKKENKVSVESVARGVVAYRVEGTNIKRRWHKPGIVKKISIDELENLLAGPGGELLLTRFLLVRDIPAREYLGLPVHEEAMMNDEKMRKVLNGTAAELKEVVPKMYIENVKRLAELAIEMEIDNMSKINYLKEKSGIDVYKGIQEKKEKEQGKDGPVKTG
ncbi:MAG: hypothetical protein WCS33_00435 [Candidatus Caldatribacteriota bacterium]